MKSKIKKIESHFEKGCLSKENVYIKKLDVCTYEIIGNKVDYYDGAMYAESRKDARNEMINKIYERVVGE